MYGTFVRHHPRGAPPDWKRMGTHGSWLEAAQALLAVGYATYTLGSIFVMLPGVTIRRIRRGAAAQ